MQPQETSELTTTEIKNHALINQAIDHMTQHPSWTNQQIAEELQISRTTLWNLLKDEQAQELMRRQLHEQETKLHKWIQDLYNTGSPTSQRTAAKLLLDTTTKLADKLRPTKTQNLNVTATIDLTELQQFKQEIYETINRLPPTTRTQIWNTWKQVKQEWTQHQPNPP